PDRFIDWRRTGGALASWASRAAARSSSSWSAAGGRSGGSGWSTGGTAPSIPPAARKPRPNTLSSVEVGDRVLHAVFGMGTVIGTAGVGDKTTADVDFGSAGTKRLSLAHAPLEKL
ncbi:MAG: ATP-dependent DNA helicase PcrA, partial [Propionibacterium sp.]|nr:ATP-dependent DNA helicase PcrA [Propionibacterium sp.]